MDSLYRDFLKDHHKDSPSVISQISSDLNLAPGPGMDPDHLHKENQSSVSSESMPIIDMTQNQESSSVPRKLTADQPIGCVTSGCGQNQSGPVTVSGKVVEISDEEIRNNRETEDGIRAISRFQNYHRGQPSNVGVPCSATEQNFSS